MANQVIENPKVFNSNLRKYETTDRGHANVFNANEKVLINNDAYLNQKITDINNQIKTINTNAGSSNTNLDNHKKDTNVHVSLTEKQAWNSKASTALASTTSNGLMSAADKVAINNLSTTIQNSITGSKVLEVIKNSDGSGSGLDADLLDGKHASEFATSNHSHNLATTTANGLMSANDKIKLDGFESSASNLENGKSIGSLQMKSCNGGSRENGKYSFAEGSGSRALGHYSHAESYGITFSNYSHAEGYRSTTFDSSSKIKIIPISTSYSESVGETKFKVADSKELERVKNFINKRVIVFSGAKYDSLYYPTIKNVEDDIITTSISIILDHLDVPIEARVNYLILESETNSTPENSGFQSSHAEGLWSITVGKISHAEGIKTIAEGKCSHTEGSYTIRQRCPRTC